MKYEHRQTTVLVKGLFSSARLILLSFILLIGCASMSREWNRTLADNNITSYERFLSKYPDSHYTKAARDSIKSLKAQQAKSANTISAWSEFLKLYPQLEQNGWILKEIHKFAFEENTKQALELLYNIDPNDEVRNKLAWILYNESVVEEDYERIIDKFSGTLAASRAHDKIRLIQKNRMLANNTISSIESYFSRFDKDKETSDLYHKLVAYYEGKLKEIASVDTLNALLISKPVIKKLFPSYRLKSIEDSIHKSNLRDIHTFSQLDSLKKTGSRIFERKNWKILQDKEIEIFTSMVLKTKSMEQLDSLKKAYPKYQNVNWVKSKEEEFLFSIAVSRNQKIVFNEFLSKFPKSRRRLEIYYLLDQLGETINKKDIFAASLDYRLHDILQNSAFSADKHDEFITKELSIKSVAASFSNKGFIKYINEFDEKITIAQIEGYAASKYRTAIKNINLYNRALGELNLSISLTIQKGNWHIEQTGIDKRIIAIGIYIDSSPLLFTANQEAIMDEKLHGGWSIFADSQWENITKSIDMHVGLFLSELAHAGIRTKGIVRELIRGNYLPRNNYDNTLWDILISINDTESFPFLLSALKSNEGPTEKIVKHLSGSDNPEVLRVLELKLREAKRAEERSKLQNRLNNISFDPPTQVDIINILETAIDRVKLNIEINDIRARH